MRAGRFALTIPGKVFDEQGRKLTATHASKSGRRYRYYVTPETVNGEVVWRIPAPELEHAVTQAMRSDTDLKHQLSRSGQSDPSDDDLATLIKRVCIHDTELRIELHESSRTIAAPFTLRRRGVETKIVLNAKANRTKDVVLIRRILRAYEWIHKIKSGRSISAIAKEENVTPEYITHNMDLAYLSPKILNAILDGKQRPDVSAYQLSKTQVPATWPEQESLFLN